MRTRDNFFQLWIRWKFNALYDIRVLRTWENEKYDDNRFFSFALDLFSIPCWILSILNSSTNTTSEFQHCSSYRQQRVFFHVFFSSHSRIFFFPPAIRTLSFLSRLSLFTRPSFIFINCTFRTDCEKKFWRFIPVGNKSLVMR